MGRLLIFCLLFLLLLGCNQESENSKQREPNRVLTEIEREEKVDPHPILENTSPRAESNWRPIYRFVRVYEYSGKTYQEHFYTDYYQEGSNAGFTYEKVQCYLSDVQIEGGLLVYRLRKDGNPRLRLYTTSSNERASAKNAGYVDDGTLGYIYSLPREGATKVYRLYKSSIGDRFYTTDSMEAQNAISSGYVEESATHGLGYALSSPPASALPDLVVTNVDAPASASGGQTIQVNVTVKNQGQGDVIAQNSVLLRVVLSADPDIKVNDTPQSDVSLDKSLLTAGNSTTRNVSLTIPANYSGCYYVGAYIDAASQHQETQEGNNSNYDAQTMSIGLPPGLVAPANNAQITTEEITFQWNSIPGAQKYEIWIDDDSTFQSPELKMQVDTTNYTLGVWLSNDTYYWKVKGITQNGGSTAFSNQYRFQYNRPSHATPIWVPCYRLYSSACSDHFYTTNPTEKNNAINSGYTLERIEFYLSFRPFESGTPLFRLHKTSDTTHYYTTSKTQRNLYIQQHGFQYEGISGFAYDSVRFKRASGGVELHHAYHFSRTDNFYTISKAEKDRAVSQLGFSDQGVTTYVSPDGKANPFSMYLPVAYLGSGVDSSFGFFQYSNQDISLPGRGLSFVFVRTYLSDNASCEGSLGFGWKHSFEARIVEGSSTAIVQWGDGNSDYYNVNGSTYTRFSEEITLYDTLVKNGDYYTVTKKDQIQYQFQLVSQETSGEQIFKEARLHKIIDRNGNQIYCNYSNGRLDYIQDSSGRRLQFVYNGNGKLNSITDPLNRQYRYEYDTEGNLTKTYDFRNYSTSYQYGSAETKHHLMKITFPKGNYLQNTYDISNGGRVTQQIDSRINPATATTFNYTTPNQVKATDPWSRMSTYGQNENHCLSSFQAANSPNANVFYNDSNNPGLPTRITDRMNRSTDFTYDIRGNNLSVINPLGQRTEYTYNDKNDVLTMKNALNHETKYYYNAQGNLSSIVDALGRSTTFLYNEYGQVSRVTDPMGRSVRLEYDAYGNLNKVQDDRNGTVGYSYDLAGRLITKTDQEGYTTRYEYDNNDNLTKTTDAKENIVYYTYDENNNLTQVNFNNHITRFTYDSQDRLENVIDPLNKEKRYEYHPNGRISKITTENGNFIEYYYDTRNRLDILNYSNSTQVRYTYNDNDKITKMVDSLGTSTYDYDELSRLKSYTNPYGKTVAYTYDEAGRRKSLVYPGNKTLTYSYYNDDSLCTISDWLNKTAEYKYDQAGNLTDVLLPNGATTKYQYNNANQLTSIQHQKHDQSILARFDSTLDLRNFPVSVTKQVPVAESLHNIDRSFTYNAAEQLVSAGTATFTYDNCGNLKTRTASRGENTSSRATATYSYDIENRLTQIQGTSTTVLYEYDGMGNRLSKTQNGVTTRYVLDIAGSMSQVLCETDANNNICYYYIYGAGLLSRISANNVQHCYHGDRIGSVVAMTDKDQNITHKYAYAPYGEVLAKEETDTNPFRYVGQHGVMDEQNGLFFMRARYYDPEMGRFINKDPIGMKGGLNLYAYPQNPIVYLDASGLLHNKDAAPHFSSQTYISQGIGLGAGVNVSGYIDNADKNKAVTLQVDVVIGNFSIGLDDQGYYTEIALGPSKTFGLSPLKVSGFAGISLNSRGEVSLSANADCFGMGQQISVTAGINWVGGKVKQAYYIGKGIYYIGKRMKYMAGKGINYIVVR